MAPSFASLPVEIVETIAGFLADGRNDKTATFTLRLSCKELHRKTLDAFARAAFSKIIIRTGSSGLARLTKISESKAFAEAVETMVLSSMILPEGYGRYKQAQYDIRTGRLDSPEEIREAEEFIDRADREQQDRAFIELSGTDGIVLSAALPRLSNLRSIQLFSPWQIGDWPLRQQDSHVEWTTRMFSVLAATMPHSPNRIQDFEVCEGYQLGIHGAVCTAALAISRHNLSMFSTLRSLTLRLSTEGHVYGRLHSWQHGLADFLSGCQELRRLDIDFVENNPTEPCFYHVAEKVILPHLQHLRMGWTRCSGEDLQTFLGNHTNLKSLVLRALDITAMEHEAGLHSLLGFLQRGHDDLQRFEWISGTENGITMGFPNYGPIEQRPINASERYVLGTDFFDDFVVVSPDNLSDGIVEDWENTKVKLRILEEDVRFF